MVQQGDKSLAQTGSTQKTAIEVRQLTGAMGAEITGVDLSDPLDNAAASAIHQAFLDHIALFFPRQTLTAAQMDQFVQRFGEPLVHPYLKPVPGADHVHELRKMPEEEINFGNVWHMEFTNLPQPSLANALYSRTVPDYGGDTLFTNMYAAWDALSPGMQEMLAPLNAVHGFSEKYKQDMRDQEARSGATKDDSDSHKSSYAEEVEREVLHPVARVHPETGRRCLYVNAGFTLRFENMTDEESAPLLQYLYRHAISPEFTFRYRWDADTFGIWDNRCSMHYALNDYTGQLRIMHRMVVLEPAV